MYTMYRVGKGCLGSPRTFGHQILKGTCKSWNRPLTTADWQSMSPLLRCWTWNLLDRSAEWLCDIKQMFIAIAKVCHLVLGVGHEISWKGLLSDCVMFIAIGKVCHLVLGVGHHSSWKGGTVIVWYEAGDVYCGLVWTYVGRSSANFPIKTGATACIICLSRHSTSDLDH